MRRFACLLVIGLLLVTACATVPASPSPSSSPGQPTPTPVGPTPTSSPSSGPSSQLLFRLAYEGGFVAPESLITRLPTMSLLADGSLIETGAVDMIYPGPILPPLLVSHLSPAAVAKFMDAVEAAGITAANQEYPARGTADAPDTVISARGPGGLFTTSLGLASPNAPLDSAEAMLRTRVADLLTSLGDWRTFLGPLAPITGDTPYQPSALRIWTTAPAPGQIDSPAPQRQFWPLAGPLADFGSPTDYQFEPLRCAVVSGPDLELLWLVLLKANQNTLFTDKTTTVRLLLRPLLPDEPSSC